MLTTNAGNRITHFNVSPGKKPGNLGEKVKNVIDSDLYSWRLTAIIRGYAVVRGNMGKFYSRVIREADSGLVYLRSYHETLTYPI
jgi:hypothetical protein